jgi:hypothetical protein
MDENPGARRREDKRPGAGGTSRGGGRGAATRRGGDPQGNGAARRGGRGGQGARSGGAPGRQGGPREREAVDDTVAKLSGPLQKVLARLPETQRRVLELRMGLADGHPHDLADTARALGLSMSEAREIEQRAFAHIREAVPLQQLQRFLDR